MEKRGMDNMQEPDVKLHFTLQASRQVKGWESGNMSFDLAKSFTHNPRLMSPSNFRCPTDDEVPSFTDDLISFRNSLALEILGPGHHHHELSAESRTEKKNDSKGLETLEYSLPIQVQEANVSPRSLSQLLNSNHQLMFFPETKIITAADDGEDGEVVSNVSDSDSSKLNWSLSASFSSLNSDASREHSGRSSGSGGGDSDGSSPEVFAKRRRKRRKTSRSSSQSSSLSQSSRGDSSQDAHPGSLGNGRLSQCSEEVSGILADAPATPNFHDSDAECSSGSRLSTRQDCSTDEDKLGGSSFQQLTTKIKYDHPVTFQKRTSIRGCRKPKPRRFLTENLNQNQPYSSFKNVKSDKLFKKFTQRSGIWEKENVKGPFFRPENPRNLTGHRIPVSGCNFNTKADTNLNCTTAFEDAWPALLKTDHHTTNPKERLLRDPAVLTVGEVVQRQPTRTQWPNKNRHPDSPRRKAWFRLENVSDLFNINGQETPAAAFQRNLEQLLRSNNKSAFGTLLEDPAVLYACRDNGQTTADHHHHHHHRASHHQAMRGNHPLKELIVWAACGNTSLPNDPAVIAVGRPLLHPHTGLKTGTVQF